MKIMPTDHSSKGIISSGSQARLASCPHYLVFLIKNDWTAGSPLSEVNFYSWSTDTLHRLVQSY